MRLDTHGFTIGFAKTAAVVLATGMLQSCEKELDFRYRDIEPIPVIEASLDADSAIVAITMTTPMDSPMDLNPVRGAVVTLADLTSGGSAVLSADSRGRYICDVGGITGHRYRLTVSLPDGGIHETESVMAAPIDIISAEFGWIKMPYDHVAVLQVDFTDSDGIDGDCYWLRVYRNGEAYKWDVVQDSRAVDGVISTTMMTTRRDTDKEDDDDLLIDGDTVTATVTPVSRGMADYLIAISSDSNGPAMFTGPLCLGYFLASPVARASLIFHPASIR